MMIKNEPSSRRRSSRLHFIFAAAAAAAMTTTDETETSPVTRRVPRRLVALLVAWSVTMYSPLWNTRNGLFWFDQDMDIRQTQSTDLSPPRSNENATTLQVDRTNDKSKTKSLMNASTDDGSLMNLSHAIPAQLHHHDNIAPLSPEMDSTPRPLHANKSTTFLTLEELTANPPEGSLDCPSPYMIPIYDRIAIPQQPPVDNFAATERIPRLIHVSFNQRCVPDELAYSIQKWKEALPEYSFYFHDDDAVERLLQQHYWDTEFPELRRVMQCVKYKGAMKIDVWRILIVYLFGGLYTDVDVTPTQWFNSSTISDKDTFFTLSDAKDRPSQWLFAMSARHPIATFTMEEIQRRLLKMKDIAKPRVVHITGPQALKVGRNKFELLKKRGQHGFDAMDTTKVSQGDTPHYIQSRMDDIVEFQGGTTTVRNKTEHISGVRHWPDQVKQNKSNIVYQGMSCHDYLTMLDTL